MDSKELQHHNSVPIPLLRDKIGVRYSFDCIDVCFDIHMFYTAFSSQNLASTSTPLEFHIVVRDTNTAGIHVSTVDISGTTVTATVITVCNLGDTVQVKVVKDSARRWGTYEGIKVSSFSGTLLSAF